MDPIINVATQAARRAGNMINRVINTKQDIEVTEKHTNDFVTNVDIAAEQIILEILQKAYPKHSFLTEESGYIEGKDTDSVWIIDPLDGTTNFIRGIPHFAVSIALKVKGVVTHAVTFNPMDDQLFSAVKGKGARMNGRRLRVSDHINVEGSVISPANPRSERYHPSYQDFIFDLGKKVAGIRHTGSATLEFAYVAAGYYDAIWRLNLKPWDYAAGALMVREAGGMVSDIAGGVDYQERGDIIAANPKLTKLLIPLVKEHVDLE